jgi:hypothetical protein
VNDTCADELVSELCEVGWVTSARFAFINAQVVLLVFLCIASLSGCASRPVKYDGAAEPAVGAEKPGVPKEELSPRCESFCGTIRICAEKNGHEDLSELMCGIARCETGDKCSGRIDSLRRRYRGAFQFSPRTWRSLCGPIFDRINRRACKPSRSIYDICCASECAAEILSRDGIGNWPACGKKASR